MPNSLRRRQNETKVVEKVECHLLERIIDEIILHTLVRINKRVRHTLIHFDANIAVKIDG